MAVISKTRIVAYQGPDLVHLFSVIEEPNGRLIILLPQSSYSEGAYGSDGRAIPEFATKSVPCLNEKYSVQPRGDKEYHTVHHTAELADKTAKESHIRTTAIVHGRVEPLFFRTIGISNPTTLRPKAKGYEMRLTAAYDASVTTLHCCVFIAPADAHMDLIEPGDLYQRELFRFRDFSMMLVKSLGDCKTITDGNTIHLLTTRRVYKRDGKRIGLGDKSPPSPGYNPEEALMQATGGLIACNQQYRLGTIAQLTGAPNFIPEDVAHQFLGGSSAMIAPGTIPLQLAQKAHEDWQSRL